MKNLSIKFKNSTYFLLLILLFTTTSSIAQSEDQWLVYENPQFGFSVNYPKDWLVEQTISNNTNDDYIIDTRISIFKDENSGLIIDIFPDNNHQSPIEWFLEHQGQFLTTEIIPQENLQIGGNEAIYIYDPGDQYTYPRHSTIFLHDNFAYRVDYQVSTSEDYLQIYRKLLTTFNFKDRDKSEAILFDIISPQIVEPEELREQSCCGYVDPNYNPYVCHYGNCTWWAKYKRPDTGGQGGATWGNASYWPARAREEGFIVNGTPAKNALICGWTNHVAYVENYSGGIADLSDMDYSATDCKVDRWRQSSLSGFDFIHNKPDRTPPSNPTSINPGCTTSSNTWQKTCNDPYFTWSGASDSESGVSGYQYYWGTSSSGTSSNYTTSRSYNPSSVGTGTYYFRLRTRDNAGNYASWKTMFILRYDGSAPSNPTSINPGCGAANNVWQNLYNDPYFTWSGASDIGSGIEGYQYYWGSSSTGTSTTYTTGTSYNPSSTGDGTYYFRVRVKDKVGNYSSWKTMFTLAYDNTSPANPDTVYEDNCGVTNGYPATSCNDPYFSWTSGYDAASGAAGYEVYFGVSSSGISPSIYTTLTQYNPPAVADGKYYLRMRTKDHAGNWSPWETKFHFEVFYLIPENLNPSGGIQVDTLIPKFSWGINNDIHPSTWVYYHISTDPNFQSNTISGWAWASNGSFDLSYNLEANTTYFWYAYYDYLSEYYGWVNGRPTPVQSFSTTNGDRVLGPPNIIAPINNPTLASVNVLLEWEELNEADYYNGWALYPMYYDEELGGWVYGGTSFTTEETFFNLKNLHPQTEYVWFVRGVNEFAYGEYSEDEYFTTPRLFYMPMIFNKSNSISSQGNPIQFSDELVPEINSEELFIILENGNIIKYEKTDNKK